MRRRLPPELIDVTLSLLADDKNTLTSCSTVCQTWHALGLRYLFSTLNIHATDDIDFADFLAFLESKLDATAFRAYIRRLTIGGIGPDDRILHLDVFEAIVGLLPSLTSLKLSTINLHPAAGNVPAGAKVAHSPKNLQHLQLSGVHIPSELYVTSPFPLSILLRPFGSVDELHVANLSDGGLGLHSATREDAMLLLPGFHVRSVTIFAESEPEIQESHSILVAIQSSSSSRSLTNLDVQIGGPRSSAALQQFLKLTGASLTKLRLDLEQLEGNHPESTRLNLSCLASLKDLTLWLILEATAEYCFSYAAGIVESLNPTQSLRLIELHLALGDYFNDEADALEELDWERLDSALSKTYHLEEVLITLADSPFAMVEETNARESEIEYIEEVLRETMGREILSVISE